MGAKGRTCFIVGAGSFNGMSVYPSEGDMIIAADGGYAYLNTLGIEPHVLLGDFDSLEIVPQHRHLIRHSPIKDDTDMALAVAYAKEQGYRRFILYGGLGGKRLDHTIANLQLITGMSREGLEVYLIGEGTIATMITGGAKTLTDADSPEKRADVFVDQSQKCAAETEQIGGEEITFDASAQGMISVFCMGAPAKGVWERGLKYSLSDAVLTDDKTLGVSNEFIGCESSISVESGTLLVMWDEKNGLPTKRIVRSSERAHRV